MLNLKLYTYKNNKTLREYIRVTDTINVITFAEIDNMIDDNNYIVDISSIVEGLKTINNKGLTFNIEQNIVKLYSNFNVKFCVIEKLADFVLENLIFMFSEKEKLYEDVDDKNEELKDDNPIIEKLKVKDLTEEQIDDLIHKLNSKLIGHIGFKNSFEKHLKEFRLFNKIGEHKILSLFIFGTSGIGKTEVARILHKLLAPSEKMIKISFGNYSSQGALNSLIGSPRGYIGSEDGELNTKLDNSRSTVILIDEFEKADKSVINFFLELLEEGKYTDMLGQEHNLDGYIIIFTSNLTEEGIKEKIVPEFINRLNYKVKFNFLNEEDKLKYLNSRVNELVEKFNKINDKKITEKSKKLFNDINVSKYNSIRDIEQEIKKKFIDVVEDIEKSD